MFWLIACVVLLVICACVFALIHVVPRGMAALATTVLGAVVYVIWAIAEETSLGTGGYVIWTPVIAVGIYLVAKIFARVVETQ